MGSCVSIHRNSDSAMKLRIETNPILIPPSPIKDNALINGGRPMNDVFIKSLKSPSLSVKGFVDNGSKDEAFFDSRAWLDSDCEDDFFSVNGDFTPSRGNTPVHHSFYVGTPRISQVHVIKDQTPAAMPEPSPTKKKKSLAELFRESSQNSTVLPAQPTLNDLALRSNPETPYMSGANSACSSEMTPNSNAWPEKEKPFGSVQCCLPSLVSRRSFSGRKKMSPAIAVNQ